MFIMPLSHVLTDNRQIGITKYRESAYPITHSHDFYEIEYVVSGRGIHNVESKKIDVKSGDLFFTNIATEHSFVSTDEAEPLVIYNLVFHPDILSNLKIKLYDSNPDATGVEQFINHEILNSTYTKFENSADAEGILELMYKEGKKQDENFEEVLKGLLIELINIINSKYKSNNAKQSGAKAIKEVMRYIDKHYSERLATEAMAKLAMMSPSYFCAKFKSIAGITATAYIMQKRLEAARKMLELSDTAISEISLNVGYESESFFRKSFKQKYGLSPASYRKNYKLQKDL